MRRAQNGSRTKKPLIRIAALIVALITVVLFAAAANKIRQAATPYSIDYRTTDYAYAASSGRFGDLYDTALRDMADGKKYSGEVKELRALAFYYENAVLANAYRGAGNTAKAAEFEDKMKALEAELGSLASSAEKVRKVTSLS